VFWVAKKSGKAYGGRLLRLLGVTAIPGWIGAVWKYLWKFVGWLGNFETIKDSFPWFEKVARGVNPPSVGTALTVSGIIWLIVVAVSGENLRQWKSRNVLVAVGLSMSLIAFLAWGVGTIHARRMAVNDHPTLDIPNPDSNDARKPSASVSPNHDVTVANIKRISPSKSLPLQHGSPCPNAPQFEIRGNHFEGTGQKSMSALENEGDIDSAYVADTTLSPTPDTTDTAIVKNKKGAHIGRLTMQNSHVGNETWWLNVSDVVMNTWSDAKSVEKSLDIVSTQLERSWRGLTPEKQKANKREWEEKKKTILSLANSEPNLFQEMHVCPSFIETPKHEGTTKQ
jgi:hypothetical protein